MIQSRYLGMQRYIKYFYKKYCTKRPDSITPGLSIYCKWLKHKGRKLVPDIGPNCYKGNKRMCFEVYKLIINKLFESENMEHILAKHLFFIRLVSLSWYFFSINFHFEIK